MEYVLGIIALFYLSYQFGKQDGKWGCFTILLVILLIGVIGTACSH